LRADGINDKGQIIGLGSISGSHNTQVFLLTPSNEGSNIPDFQIGSFDKIEFWHASHVDAVADDPENLRGREVFDHILEIWRVGVQTLGEFRPHDPGATVTAWQLRDAKARAPTWIVAGSSIETGGWSTACRLIEASRIYSTGDDAKVGLGRGDIVKAAEKEHDRGNHNDDGQSADKGEKSHGEPLVFWAISSSVEPESHGVFG
jgi:hypothetical protein